mgnify:CR=1 FL=1
MLLEGDIAGLLTIPFESIEIERWESSPFNKTTHKIPNFPKGFQLDGNSHDTTFSAIYNCMKILTEDFHNGWPHAKDAGFIDSEQKEKLEKFLNLPENIELSEQISSISEPGAYEIQICPEHIHRFRITKSGIHNGIKAEYIQDRNHRRNDNYYYLEPLLNLFDINQKSITSIVGKEVIASAELIHVNSIERYISFLEEEIKINVNEIMHEKHVGIGYLSMMSKSQVTKLNEIGIIDINELTNVWKAYHGYRKFWNNESSIKQFDKEFFEANGEHYTISWDDPYLNSENPLVSIIPYYNEEITQKLTYGLDTLSEPSAWTSIFLNREDIQDEEKWYEKLRKLENFSITSDFSIEDDFITFIRGCFFIEDFVLNYCTKDLAEKLSFHNNSTYEINDIFLRSSPEVRGIISRAKSEFNLESMGRICFPFFQAINDDFLDNKSLLITPSWKTVVVSRGIQIPFDKLSHGESRLLQILWIIGQDTISLINHSRFRRWKTVIIDEPEVGLHIDWQRKLTIAIKGFYNSDSDSLQVDPVNVILCTHSPEIVASAPEDSISIQPVNLEE